MDAPQIAQQVQPGTTNKFRLTSEMISRVLLWGIVGGGVLGAIYGPLSLTLITLLDALGIGPDAPDRVPGFIQMMPVWVTASCVGGALIGGQNGLLVGIADGLALSILTAFVLRPREEGRRYRMVLAATSAAIGGLGTFILLMLAGPPIPGYRDGVRATWSQIGISLEWLLYVVLPALIATGYGWWLGNRATRWVERLRDLQD